MKKVATEMISPLSYNDIVKMKNNLLKQCYELGYNEKDVEIRPTGEEYKVGLEAWVK